MARAGGPGCTSVELAATVAGRRSTLPLRHEEVRP